MIKTKRLLALALALVMLASVLTACGEPKDSSDATPDEAELQQSMIYASPLQFLSSGKYTTTVISEKTDLSKLTAENVEVKYYDSDITATPDEITEFYSQPAKVENVSKNSDGGYDIAFTDDKAEENQTSSYLIEFKDLDAYTTVAVEFPEITLTPDVDSMVACADDLKVSLVISDGEFAKDISKDDITLGNAFEEMDYEIISSSGKNLTLELKGKPVRNVAGAYQWGTIAVDTAGTTNRYAPVPAKINIELEYVGLDSSSLKYKDGKITGKLALYSSVTPDDLTNDNIKIDGVIVDEVKKIDENSASLTLSADGIKSINDFAAIVNGKTATLGDYETTLFLDENTFYPVFDYIEDDGDNLKFTLKLYAQSGTFDKNLNAGQISFGDGFKNAKVESVELDSDNLATLILTVPAGKQTADAVNMTGSVTLDAKALINAWGESASKPFTYTREYTNDSLGREVTLNTDTLEAIQTYTRGKDTVFGSILYYGGVAASAYSFIKSVLEVTGVIKSEHEQIMEEFQKINKKIDAVLDGISDVKLQLKDIEVGQKKTQMQQYDLAFNRMNSYLNDIIDTYNMAAIDIALEDAVAAGELDEMPDFSYMSPEEYEAALEDLSVYLPDVDSMTDKEAAAYNNRLVDYIRGNADYEGFDDNMKNLKAAYIDVVGMLSRTDDMNPIRIYDEICSMTYNFDTQSYDFRTAMRLTAKTQLAKALAVFMSYNKSATNPKNTEYKNRKKDLDTVSKQIDNMPVTNLPANKIDGGSIAKHWYNGEKEFDVNNYPYSYVFGKHVSFYKHVDIRDYYVANKNSKMYKDDILRDPQGIEISAAMRDGDKYRNWTYEEQQDFLGRIHGKTIVEELSTAGYQTENYSYNTNNYLVTSISIKNPYYMHYADYTLSGSGFEKDKNTLTNNKDFGTVVYSAHDPYPVVAWSSFVNMFVLL